MFNTRLIEMVVVALHQFGVHLHRRGFRMHRGDIEYMINWTMPEDSSGGRVKLNPWKPPPTISNHPFYHDSDIYPDGVDDMVGYWVEDRILGGVVFFDRRAELDDNKDLTGETSNTYIHPARPKVMMHVAQLLDWQQQALVGFLLAKPDWAAPGDT